MRNIDLTILTADACDYCGRSLAHEARALDWTSFDGTRLVFCDTCGTEALGDREAVAALESARRVDLTDRPKVTGTHITWEPVSGKWRLDVTLERPGGVLSERYTSLAEIADVERAVRPE